MFNKDELKVIQEVLSKSLLEYDKVLQSKFMPHYMIQSYQDAIDERAVLHQRISNLIDGTPEKKKSWGKKKTTAEKFHDPAWDADGLIV